MNYSFNPFDIKNGNTIIKQKFVDDKNLLSRYDINQV